ncbi:MAG: methylmalonyl Co-A mutase-associated GTPase MeaB [Flammeovirgaceae bacterium]|nr:MAG: methylmalonyl Co-A mutase-associated GTPase MeaB [Flammeovirgaceae bacterium]
MKQRLRVNEYLDGINRGDRLILAKALTLIESTLDSDRKEAGKLLGKLKPTAKDTIRIGITGVPGVGKSSFIESFGSMLTKHNKKVAVLTVDPTSQLSKGSILGDKTRMEILSKNPAAFIRPSPSGGALGGTALRTRESILLCEAAGFDVILVETVGVGQSEVAVKGMVDFFLLLILAGAGDALQGIKRGIMEMADGLVITKADGDNKKKSAEARAEYQQALQLFRTEESGWEPPVLTCSALEHTGMEEIWKMILSYKEKTSKNNFWKLNRQRQSVNWFHEYVQQGLMAEIQQSPRIGKLIRRLELEVVQNNQLPVLAGEKLLAAFRRKLLST